MIDPATGTGTFLVEWLRHAHKSFLASGESGDWPEHLRDHVLPSMHAFENMLAPYAIAHLKVALELHATGVGDTATQILLTDTLDHRPTEQQLTTMQDPVAAEGERAAQLKEFTRFTVVVGNPPYDREQRDEGVAAKRKGGVIRHGAPGIALRGLGRKPGVSTTRATRSKTRPPALLDDVTEPMRDAGLGVHIKNLYNDYVYFWRWAVWQATELPPGPGVVAFITASSYLDGVSMGGVRALLRDAFDELWIIDLGGEGRGAQTEENVFDIRTPVAIAIGICKARASGDNHENLATPEACAGETNPGQCSVRYLRLSGSRADKLTRLGTLELDDVAERVAGDGLDSFTPRSESRYYDWPKITDVFPWIRSGSKLGRVWPIAESVSPLKQRWDDLVSAVPRERSDLFIETSTGKKLDSKPSPLLSAGPQLPSLATLDRHDEPEGFDRYGYRSFDRHWVIADHRLADRAGPDLWQTRGPHQVFLTTLTSTKIGRGPALTVTPYVPDLDHFSGRGAKNVMPLYSDPSDQSPNVATGLLDIIGTRLGIEVSPEDLLAYVHALAGTAAFTERFEDELSEVAGPIHLPITADPDLFRQAVELGRDLLWWHTWGERFAPTGQTRLPPGQAQQVSPVEGMPEKYHYDPDTQLLTVGTGTFGPVTPEVWNFEVSGLKVLDSWLGYRMKKRKGR